MGSAVTPTSAAQIKWAQEGCKCPEGPHCPGDVRGTSGCR